MTDAGADPVFTRCAASTTCAADLTNCRHNIKLLLKRDGGWKLLTNQ